jgi:nitroreductase
MQFSEAIKKRRAVKHFDAGHKIPSAVVEKFWDLVRESPSSFNVQHWRIVNVENPDMRTKIKDAAWGQAQVTDASFCFVICGDSKAWEKNPERYWASAPEEVKNTLVPMIGDFYSGNETLQRDEVMRSAGILAQSMMLAATSLGYESCPMIGFDANKVAEIIQLPEDHLIGLILTIGKGTKEAHPKGGYLPLEEVLFSNHF